MQQIQTPLHDLGDQVAGQVLDEAAWQHEDRARAAQPHRHVIGEVAVVYPMAPEIVGVRLDSGVEVTIAVGGLRCSTCPHDPHEAGECLVATTTPDGLPAYCCCGAE